MALNGDVLGELIKSATDTVVAAATASGQPISRDDLFKAMGNAIVNYITTNAVVVVPGVTSGTFAAAGTIT